MSQTLDAIVSNAVNRWAVTGTPVFRKGIDDLGILLRFLGRAPYDSDTDEWQHVVAMHREGDWRPLLEAFQPSEPAAADAAPLSAGEAYEHTLILWRDASDPDVERHLNLPCLSTEIILVPPTSVEAQCYKIARSAILERKGLGADPRRGQDELLQRATNNPVMAAACARGARNRKVTTPHRSPQNFIFRAPAAPDEENGSKKSKPEPLIGVAKSLVKRVREEARDRSKVM
jgi:hypothetical protein